MIRNLKTQLWFTLNHSQPSVLSNALPCFRTEQFRNDYISSLCQQNMYNEALKAFDFLKNHTNFMIRPSTYACLISACSSLRSLEHGRKVHDHILASKCQPDIVLHNHILNMYGKCGSLEDARMVFDDMPQRNVVSWTAVIAGYSQKGQGNDAIDLYFQMLQSGIMPDQFTFGSIIKACSGFSQLGYELEALCHFKEMLRHGGYQPNEFIFGSVLNACSSLLNHEYGRQIHGMRIKFGLGRDIFSGCSLCDMYARCGLLDFARMVFNEIENPDLASWNAIIAGIASGSNVNEAMPFFSEMRHLGLIPDGLTVRSLLCACTSSLALYQACLQHNQPGEVFRLFSLMLASQNKPDRITLTTVLGACAEIASLETGNQVHCYIMKTGFGLNISIMNGLIDMYIKCGSLENARELFNSMEAPDVFSWSSLIVGYAQFGCGEEALKLFKKMRSLEVRPNEVTFIGVLTACSHVGLVEEGLQLYKTMETKYGIKPTIELYSCVVDLLARAGCLHEAEDFIYQMAFDPDVVVWKSLLAACKTHGNVDVGKRAAENILNIDPTNSAAHVLLCNLYASSGRWGDVARLRSSMKVRGVQKVPGQSWIEIKDKINLFSAEDSIHPERDKIYTTLEELCLQMLDDGYPPLQLLTSTEPLNWLK